MTKLIHIYANAQWLCACVADLNHRTAPSAMLMIELVSVELSLLTNSDVAMVWSGLV